MAVTEDAETPEVSGVWPFTLARGYAARKQESVCLLQAAAWLSTGQVDYSKANICQVIARFGTGINDILNDTDRQILQSFPAQITGTLDPWVEKDRKEVILRHVMQVVDFVGRNHSINMGSHWLMSYMDSLKAQPDLHSKETLYLLVHAAMLINRDYNPINYFVHKVIDSARLAVQEFHNFAAPYGCIGHMLDVFENALLLSSLYARCDDRLNDATVDHIHDCFTDMLAIGKSAPISAEAMKQRLVKFEAYTCQPLV